MRHRLRPVLVLLGCAAALALLTPGPASAHYSSTIAPPDPQSGPGGTRVALHGLLHAEPGEVSVRWMSVTGPSLGPVTLNPTRTVFSAVATIPDAPPGVYSIMLMAGDERVASTAFEITPAAVGPGAIHPAAAGGAAAPGRAPYAVALAVIVAALAVTGWRLRRRRAPRARPR